MPEAPQGPEPVPGARPSPPGPSSPAPFPQAPSSPAPMLDADLLGRRVVRIWGPLDDQAVNRASAELMALDAMGDDPVQMFVASSGGPLHLALTLVDTMDLLGVPVNVTCLGSVEGAAVALVAAGQRRVAAPHSQFHLCAPGVSVSGNASALAAWAEHHRLELERFTARLALATGRHSEHVEADLSLGRWLDAEAALRYGLVDEIWGPGPGRGPIDRPQRPFGFGPAPGR